MGERNCVFRIELTRLVEKTPWRTTASSAREFSCALPVDGTLLWILLEWGGGVFAVIHHNVFFTQAWSDNYLQGATVAVLKLLVHWNNEQNALFLNRYLPDCCCGGGPLLYSVNMIHGDCLIRLYNYSTMQPAILQAVEFSLIYCSCTLPNAPV